MYRPWQAVPGEHLAIDWGSEGDLHVFCAVLVWSRVRFVRFAADESQATTLALLAECLETLGGVPGIVLADRMGCLKGGVVANVVVPAPGYLAFALHYGFRPDFCEAADPESKGVVEHLVGYAKADLVIPGTPFTDLATANAAAVAWCAEVNARSTPRRSRGPGRAPHSRGRRRCGRCPRCARQRRRPRCARSTACGPSASARPATACPARSSGPAGRARGRRAASSSSPPTDRGRAAPRWSARAR